MTLRRVLTAIVGGLVAAVAIVVVTLSGLALHTSLVAQLDTRLTEASARAQTAGDRDGMLPLSLPGSASDSDETRPPGLLGLGQAAGTVALYIEGSDVRAGYVDSEGTFHSLDSGQISALEKIPNDGAIHSVAVPGLGSYRAIGTTTPEGAIAVTALPLADIHSTVTGFVVAASLVGLVAAVGAGVLGGILVSRALRPLDRLTRTAERVTGLSLERGGALPLRVPGGDTDPGTEVGRLGASFNAMLAHIDHALVERDQSERTLRTFVADASHELRTPLASVRGYADLMARDSDALTEQDRVSLERIRAESARMARLVDDLLLLARLDAERPLESVAFDAVPLLVEAITDAHVTGPDHQWRLDLEHSAEGSTEPESDEEGGGVLPAFVQGDPSAFRQIVGNLLANARIHTPPGTTVRASLRHNGAAIILTIADNGPGIPESLRSEAFARFVKGDTSRTPGKGSTGLGLSIVAALASAQGGNVRLDDASPGAVFTVSLPAADHEPTD